MQYLLEDFRAFLEASPTSWHAVKEIGNRLAEKEFIPLALNESWTLEKGKRYFVVSGGSLCAFALPKTPVKKAMILATHTDSPALKIKPQPQVSEENMLLLEVETYGSPLLTSWMNRDLAIAGRVVLKGGEENSSILTMLPCLFLSLPSISTATSMKKDSCSTNKSICAPLPLWENIRPIWSICSKRRSSASTFFSCRWKARATLGQRAK